MRSVAALSLFALALASLPPATAHAQDPLPFVGGDIDQDAILARLDGAVPRRVRQVGTSSVTLRLTLREGHAAYKPRTSSHPVGYLAEIAAYRVARFLRLDNVPPVVSLSIPRVGMRERFEGDFEEDWEPINEAILWDRPGASRGAAIYWIPSMEDTDLAEPGGLDRVASWLRIDGAIPEEQRAMARDLSIMLAFDYLIGNWDRFSGGNITTDDAGRRLFMRDHNVAFQAPLTSQRYARMRQLLERVQRFSRSFVEAVEELDEATLRAALAEDPEGSTHPILTDDQIRDVMSRRRALLSYVGAQVALHGAEATLSFE
jgi:hypothetical protein